jgi:RHS repeat-associated protein
VSEPSSGWGIELSSGLGQLRLETHPELGAGGNGSKAYDFYDVLGNPGSATIMGTSGAGLRSQAFRYDAAGRLIEVFSGLDLEHPLKQYFYSRQNASGTNKTQGKLVRTRRHHPELGLWIAESFEYTGFGGRMSKKVTSLTGQPEGPDAFSQSYTYNSLGELASITYPQCGSSDAACVGVTTGRTVDYGFNRGLLDSVTGWVPEIDYSANGRISRLLHGAQCATRPPGSECVEEIQENDPDGQLRPKSLQVKKGASVLWDTSTYQFDGTGNIKAIGTETFQYDKVSRLLEGRVLQTAPSSFQTEALTFDAFGNITSRSVSGAANSAPAVTGSTNRLTGGTYDASGNLLQLNANSTQHTFDVLDEMRQRQDGSTTWQYLYTADGERVIERNPATGLMRWTLRGPGNQPLRIVEDRGPGQWSLLRDYIYAGGRLVASVGTEGERHYHLDHLGSVRLETDSAGNIVKQRTFLPFGEELATTPVSENELRFTGHERDDLVPGTSTDDLDYMHARFCSPTTGRFLSVDPVLGNPMQPQAWNRYSYVASNPLNAIDPTGMESAQLRMDNLVRQLQEGEITRDEYMEMVSPSELQPVAWFIMAGVGGASVLEATPVVVPYLAEAGAALAIKYHSAVNFVQSLTTGGAGSLPTLPRSVGAAGKAIDLTSRIGDSSFATRLAERLGQAAQRDVDGLLTALRGGNLNPGIGTRALGNGFFELRGANAGRVVVRQTASTAFDVLAKFQAHVRGDAANSEIIRRIMSGYEP